MVAKPTASGGVTERDMFREIMEEIRHIRSRLDAHIAEEADSFDCLRRDLSSLRESMAEHKTRLSMVTSGIAVVVAAVVTFLADIFKK